MKTGDRVIVTEPMVVVDTQVGITERLICDIETECGATITPLYATKLTPVEPEKIDLWRVEAGPAKYTCDTEAEARELAKFFKAAKVHRLIAYRVKEEP